MKCFVFSEKQNAFPDICGTTPLNDLIVHLRNCGITEIFCNEEPNCGNVSVMSYESAKPHLGRGWIAASAGCITRQSPLELRDSALAEGACNAISLSCSDKPWEHLSVFTDGMGFVEKFENSPPPEMSETNLVFSGMIWVGGDFFDPGDLSKLNRASAVLLTGYWRCPNSRESYLLSVHDILRGAVSPWPHLQIPADGRIQNSRLPADTLVCGTLWLGSNCSIGKECILENCVILDGSSVEESSNLRNCLVMPGMRIPRGTVQDNKYLSFPGDDNG
jgi:hypothetical protein